MAAAHALSDVSDLIAQLRGAARQPGRRLPGGANCLAIDLADCIDCAVCVPERPVSAIFAEDDGPGPQQHFTALNADLARVWKPITRTQAALPDAEAWRAIEAKLDHLQR